MKPDVQRIDSLFHLCYNQSVRIYTAKAYPILSPNGSTIFLIGCENGLQILWHGGRLARTHRKGSADGNKIHLNFVETEGEAESSLHSEGLHAQQDEDDYDSSMPCKSLVQSIKLPFGTAVLQLAVPYIPTDALQQHHKTLPALYTKNLVMAVVCSDSSVRLVILPLAPPTESAKRKAEAAGKTFVANKQSGVYGERTLIISEGSDYPGVPKCVALTLTHALVETSSDLDVDRDDDKPGSVTSIDHRPTSRTWTRSISRSRAKNEAWDILVASCSSNASSPLLIHRAAMSSNGSRVEINRVPWSIQHVRSPLVSLQFHPALPGDKMNGRLLAAESNGMVKILSCPFTGASPRSSCLVSLNTNCQPSRGNRGMRQYILDAQWMLGGKAVLALLDDGEWGLWNLEGYGPRFSRRTIRAQTPRFDLYFSFAICDYIGHRPNTLKASEANPPTQDGFKAVRIDSTTPNTRRKRQENLFSGPLRDRDRPARGSISTVPNGSSRKFDEAVLLWHNDELLVIPSLRTYLENRTQGHGNLFSNGPKGEATILSNVSLRGERHTSVSLLPMSDDSTYNDSAGYSVLVTGETRFVLVTGPSSGEQAKSRRPASPPNDQKLREQGDLDLDGMQSVLTSMSGKLHIKK
ncbi:MAG: hypothetical protein LQ341_000224 [Variospora aurantia]|nr:MAG: hypothetical protein LQ341_000224 [Variospora aurantia]